MYAFIFAALCVACAIVVYRSQHMETLKTTGKSRRGRGGGLEMGERQAHWLCIEMQPSSRPSSATSSLSTCSCSWRTGCRSVHPGEKRARGGAWLCAPRLRGKRLG